MNRETRIKRTIGIIMLVFIIGVLTFGMFLPTIEKNTIVQDVNITYVKQLKIVDSEVKNNDNKGLSIKVEFDW